MVVEENNSNNNNGGWAPIGSPMNVNVQSIDDSHLTNFESSVNAVSFGFVATAILISMFLLMAIFERFLRPNNSDEFSPSARRTSTDLEPQMAFPGKLGHPSPKNATKVVNIAVVVVDTNSIVNTQMTAVSIVDLSSDDSPLKVA
nr:uncharacterized protein LOC112770489 [Arachis hypogaea]